MRILLDNHEPRGGSSVASNGERSLGESSGSTLTYVSSKSTQAMKRMAQMNEADKKMDAVQKDGSTELRNFFYTVKKTQTDEPRAIRKYEERRDTSKR
ncbi:hypothetical protein F442_22175 [Phytophthora nicotianae P10297]|uniref:Uncharacterized protein n=2 Tax=Phytophthora nicotianae TaxID=4792 RepID=W2Y1N0_PHYNI|nr:hypothetical protein F444_22286 [Phytophthora nicotianae P1976]ETP28533.1 hypothetical protein F442_22175 [Phytophthora nicotianae P10297]